MLKRNMKKKIGVTMLNFELGGGVLQYANMSIFVRIMYQFVSALAQKVIWILIVFIMFLALA